MCVCVCLQYADLHAWASEMALSPRIWIGFEARGSQTSAKGPWGAEFAKDGITMVIVSTTLIWGKSASWISK